MPASSYLQQKMLDHMLGISTLARPAAVWFGLLLLAESGPGPEVAGGGYLRQEVHFLPAAAGAAVNVELVTFPAASRSWGTVNHFGIYDAATGGNLLAIGSLASPMVVAEDDQLLFDAGAITVTVA